MSGERALVLPSHGIPQANGIVLPTRTTSERFAIRTKRDANDPLRMASKGILLLTGDHVPQTEGIFIISSIRECFAIRTERNTIDRLRISEGKFVLTCHSVPEADGPVPTPTSERLSIRTERYTID